MAKLKRPIAIAAATALILLVGALVVHEWDAVRDRPSTSEVEQELLAALPIGSSEANVNRYLSERALRHHTDTVTAEDAATISGYRELDIGAGARFIYAYFEREGSVIWLSDQEVHLYFVLDNSGVLEDIGVLVYDIK